MPVSCPKHLNHNYLLSISQLGVILSPKGDFWQYLKLFLIVTIEEGYTTVSLQLEAKDAAKYLTMHTVTANKKDYPIQSLHGTQLRYCPWDSNVQPELRTTLLAFFPIIFFIALMKYIFKQSSVTESKTKDQERKTGIISQLMLTFRIFIPFKLYNYD